MDDEFQKLGYFCQEVQNTKFGRLGNVVGVSFLEALIFLPIRNILTVRQVWYMPPKKLLSKDKRLSDPNQNATKDNVIKDSATPPPNGFIKAALFIIKQRGGLTSLHQGLLPEVLIRSLSEVLTFKSTSFVYRIFFGIVKLSDDFIVKTSFKKVILAKVLGQVLGALILRPLSLVQTRLMVQKESEKIYSTPYTMYKIYEEEGGAFALFFGPSFLSFLMYQIIISISNHAMNYSIFSLGLAPGSLTYTACKMLLKTLELLIIIPLETVSNKLACQRRRSAKSLERKETPKLLPEIPPLCYTSTLNCFEEICFQKKARTNIANKEIQAIEDSKFKASKSEAKVSKSVSNFKISELYRDFKLRWAASLVLIYLHKFRLEAAR